MDQNDVESMQASIKTVAITDQIAERFIRLFNSNSINNQLVAKSKLAFTQLAKNWVSSSLMADGV